MLIRKMKPNDYEAAFKLWTSAKGVGLRSLDDSKGGIANFLGRNKDTCFVAVMDGELVGTILCGNDGRRGYIYHAMVSAEHRGNGTGKALVNAVLDALKQTGINKTALVVFADNVSGINFWKRMGFVKRDDIVYMDKSLNDLNK